MLTSHFTQERYNNNCNFSVGGVAFLFVFFVVAFWFGFIDTAFYSQEKKEKREQLEKKQKKLQAVHGDEAPSPWSPPGKVTYSRNY